MADENKTEKDTSAESPTSVLNEEEKIEEKTVADRDEEILDAKDGESFLASEAMSKEEEELMKAREDEERANETVSAEAPELDADGFTKLDELLTKTQIWSKFIDNNVAKTMETVLDQMDEPKGKGRGRKRKNAPQYSNKRAQKAVAAMLTKSREGDEVSDLDLTEAERMAEEQRKLVPLLTGGKLKSYQLKGVKWLISLWNNGVNGILADQMGLGKTIQTIGFLAHLKGQKMDGPYLVIAPLSTLSNWVNEISRFAPSMNAIIYHGDKNQRKELREKHMLGTIGPEFPIVVTSYEVAMSDARSCFKNFTWKYVVIDEGHRLKNHKCKLLKELKCLKMSNKLLLTGTPLQNNLSELWSLLNFILPQVFPSLPEFESWFDLSVRGVNGATLEEREETRRAQVVAKLHAILRPFILRRMKSDVEQLLPQKKEIIIYATLTDHQKKFQEHLLNNTLEKHLLEDVVPGSGCGMKGKLNNLMIQLRKNCNHPDLLESQFSGSYLYPPVEEIVEQCGKFRLLERLLVRLLAKNHKVLIFSQWTRILDIMDYYFSEKGFDVCRIDGSVKLDERKRQIEAFNDHNSECRMFLLSTRAGGLGINLTSADTCILYDSDWNPQMDLQAMDRCHRIGQTKPVHVYRLATAQSVEGRILKRAFKKLKLEHVVIGKGEFHRERVKTATVLKEEDIIALLREEETEEDKRIETDISDEDLERLMDRTDLIHPQQPILPLKGPGWEVVLPTSASRMLSTLNS